MTSLLPPNRTPLESAMSAVIAGSFPRGVGAIADIFDADRCPAELLPFLAWELSVDLWDDRWHEATKRKACRDAYRLHALKTTLAGVREHVALTGARLKRAFRPGGNFHYPAMDDARRSSWLDRLPQIRLEHFSERAEVKARAYYRRSRQRSWDRLTFDRDEDEWSFDATGPLMDMAGDDPAPARAASYLGYCWIRASRGPSLMGTRAIWWDRGQQRAVTLSQPEAGVYQVMVPSDAPRSYQGAAHFGTAHLQRSRADDRIVTFRPTGDAGSFAIGFGVEPTVVSPRLVPTKRTPPAAAAFLGRYAANVFLRRSIADRLMVEQVSIHVADRMNARRRARMYFGHARIGGAPFSAELQIEVPMRRPRSRRGAWHGAGYLKAADMRPLANAIQAVKVSKAFRDTIRIDTAMHRTVEFSDGLRFGDFTFGQIMEAN